MNEPTTRQPVEHASGNVLAERVAQLARLFPEAVSEGKIDFDKLRAALGDAVVGPERFYFTWAGKQSGSLPLQVV